MFLQEGSKIMYSSDCNMTMHDQRKGLVLAVYVEDKRSSGWTTAKHSVSVCTAGYLLDL